MSLKNSSDNPLERIVMTCHELLYSSLDAIPILSKANDRVSRQAQKKFLFGYFPSHGNLNSIYSIVGDQLLIDTKLIYERVSSDDLATYKTKHSILENHNLVMPYRDVYGNVIAIVGRSIMDDNDRKSLKIPKYKNTSFDKGRHLFGLFEAKESVIQLNQVYVVEGQFDVITAHDKGLFNIVALGSSSMTFEQFALLKRYTNNITLLLDSDDAGKLGIEKAIKMFSKYSNIKSIELPKGFKDIDEFLKECDLELFTQST